jgi:hypothetical protein
MAPVGSSLTDFDRFAGDARRAVFAADGAIGELGDAARPGADPQAALAVLEHGRDVVVG